jgi:hypothetical protein
MVYAVSSQAAAPTRFERTTATGASVWRTMYFGPAPSPESSDSVRPDVPNLLEYLDPEAGETRPPQAFLVEQAPGAITGAHFHFVDQFQVVVAGDGTIGRHDVRPVSAHFASACTGYGPITPGAAGLKYFTLRASADTTGAQYLPAARPKMRPTPKRNLFFDPVLLSAPQALRERVGGVIETLHEGDDGLGAFVVRLGPGAEMIAPDASRGAGASLLVLEGALQAETGQLDRWSCLFFAAGDGAPTLRSTAAGAEVLVLRYPRPPRD